MSVNYKYPLKENSSHAPIKVDFPLSLLKSFSMIRATS